MCEMNNDEDDLLKERDRLIDKITSEIMSFKNTMKNSGIKNGKK